MRFLIVTPVIEKATELAAQLPAEVRVATHARLLGELPDLVLVDCGAETANVSRALKSEHPMLPIIAITDETQRLDAIRAGVDHCLAPPISIDELVSRAERLVENSKRHRTVLTNLEDLQGWHDWMRHLVHDLRNPITVALCAVSLARENQLVTEHEDLQEAERALEETATKLRDILDADRIKQGVLVPRLEPIDLASLALEVSRRLPLASSIDLSVNGDTSITVDPFLIGRVFGNLIANANRHAVRRPVRVQIAGGSHGVSAHITNDGPGIAPDLEPHLFEWRSTGSKSYGIGLAFCRLVCEAHAGKIWLDNGSEGRVTFAFGLPRVESG